MTRAQRDTARVGPEMKRLQARAIEGSHHDGDVGQALAKAGGRVHDFAEVNAHLHVRPALSEQGQRLLHRLVIGRHQEADRQERRALSSCRARRRNGAVRSSENGASVLEHRFARGGQFDLSRRALQKALSDTLLQLADLRAQRLLGEVEPLGGPREVELLGHGHEGPQVLQLNAHCRADSKRASQR